MAETDTASQKTIRQIMELFDDVPFAEQGVVLGMLITGHAMAAAKEMIQAVEEHRNGR